MRGLLEKLIWCATAFLFAASVIIFLSMHFATMEQAGYVSVFAVLGFFLGLYVILFICGMGLLFKLMLSNTR